MITFFLKSFIRFLILFLLLSDVTANSQYLYQTGSWGTGSYEDVCVQGNYAYCATSKDGLDILDWSDPAFPIRIGHCFINDYFSVITIEGNYAFLGGGGFYVVDISDPTSPLRVFSDPNSHYIHDIKIENSYAYLIIDSDSYAFFQVMDISDPMNPFVVNTLSLPNSLALDVYNSIVYVARKFGGLVIINCSIPAMLWIETVYEPSLRMIDIVIEYPNASLLCGSTDQGQLRMLDISDPAQPVTLSSVPVHTPVHVACSGNLCAVSNYYNKCFFVDVSDPSSPVVVSEVEKKVFEWVGSMKMPDDQLFLAAYSLGLYSIDLTNPSSPVWTGHFQETPSGRGLDVHNNIAVLGTDTQGVIILDVNDRRSPQLLGTYSPLFPFDTKIQDIVIVDNLAFCAASQEGLLILDITDPSMPCHAGTFLQDDMVHQVAVWEDLACINNVSEVRVLNVSQPSTPLPIGSVFIGSQIVDMVVRDSYLFAACGSLGLAIIDMNSFLKGNRGMVMYETRDDAGNVAVQWPYVYVTITTGLEVVDVSDPMNPVEAGYTNQVVDGRSICILGTKAYVNVWGKILVVDISDPATPVFLGEEPLPFFYYKLDADDAYVYANSLFGAPFLILDDDPPVVPCLQITGIVILFIFLSLLFIKNWGHLFNKAC